MKKEIKDSVVKAYALKNAVEHDGKCVVGSVISGLFAEGLKKEDVKNIMMKVSFAVNEVNKMSPELQKVELEQEYLQKKSFLFDIEILIKTFTNVLFSKGVSH